MADPEPKKGAPQFATINSGERVHIHFLLDWTPERRAKCKDPSRYDALKIDRIDLATGAATNELLFGWSSTMDPPRYDGDHTFENKGTTPIQIKLIAYYTGSAGDAPEKYELGTVTVNPAPGAK